MSHLKITLNGKPVPLNNFADVLMGDIRQSTRNLVAEHFASFRCEDHPDFAPAIRGAFEDLESGNAKLNVCCEKMASHLRNGTRQTE
jgi:hypothetical protein